MGKELGNNGQCNPTYFTVGNLAQDLPFLEKEGLSRQQILDNSRVLYGRFVWPVVSACTMPRPRRWQCSQNFQQHYLQHRTVSVFDRAV